MTGRPPVPTADPAWTPGQPDSGRVYLMLEDWFTNGPFVQSHGLTAQEARDLADELYLAAQTAEEAPNA